MVLIHYQELGFKRQLCVQETTNTFVHEFHEAYPLYHKSDLGEEK
jgi:hypothetical protein